ncbi:MAG: ABC transporter permease [Cardiobacteriaceae bacterium]|nr:ABC transporter permease [Cardiobacteriaceae bacterium]
MRDLVALLISRSDFFIQLFWEHIYIAGSAALLAALLGISLGILISEQRRLAPWIIQTSNLLYTIPAISMFGLLIPVTGIGNNSAIITLTIYGLLPMIGNTYNGMKNIDLSIIDAARGMGSSRMQILWKIRFPLALPTIMTALRTMLVMTIALGGIASFIGAGGLGTAIYRGITTNNSTMTLAGSLLIMMLAFIADGLCRGAERCVPWIRQHD